MFQEALHTYSHWRNYHHIMLVIHLHTFHIVHIKANKIGVTHSDVVAMKLARAPALCPDSILQLLIKVIIVRLLITKCFNTNMNGLCMCSLIPSLYAN